MAKFDWVRRQIRSFNETVIIIDNGFFYDYLL